MTRPAYTLGMNAIGLNKDPWSALTHFAGVLLGIPGLIYLVLATAHDGPKVAGMAIYGATLVLLFASSTAYHFFDLGERGNLAMQRVDHAAIYAFIAGSYVPPLMHLLDGPARITMLSVVGGLALVGAVFKVVWMDCPTWLSTGLYVALGWIALVPGPWMFPLLDASALGWLIAGGVAYTLGAVVYANHWPDPLPDRFGHHEVWHLFVLAGAACHFAFVAGLVELPRPGF